MDVDPFLYISLGVGVLLGYIFRPSGRWLGWATQATILVLLFFLGISIAALPSAQILPAIGRSLLLVALVLGLTLLLAWCLRRGAPERRTGPAAGPRPAFPTFSALLVAAVIVGYVVGSRFPVSTQAPISYALYALLLLVGLGLRLVVGLLRRLWVPLTSAAAGALAAGAIYALLTGTSLAASWAVTLGFGWYSLDGPLVAASAGASLGFVAFLSNFLRENLTMIVAPSAGSRLGGEGLTAMGGATSMDTTLYFITRYGDPDAGTLALASGLVLTVAASLLVPALLAIAA